MDSTGLTNDEANNRGTVTINIGSSASGRGNHSNVVINIGRKFDSQNVTININGCKVTSNDNNSAVKIKEQVPSQSLQPSLPNFSINTVGNKTNSAISFQGGGDTAPDNNSNSFFISPNFNGSQVLGSNSKSSIGASNLFNSAPSKTQEPFVPTSTSDGLLINASTSAFSAEELRCEFDSNQKQLNDLPSFPKQSIITAPEHVLPKTAANSNHPNSSDASGVDNCKDKANSKDGDQTHNDSERLVSYKSI
jgi:hypothetical protein